MMDTIRERKKMENCEGKSKKAEGNLPLVYNWW